MGTRRHRERLDDDTETKTTPQAKAPRKRATPSQSDLTLLDCISDHHLFAPWFKDASTWLPWFAYIAALFALPMSPDMAAIYRQCTGRTELPSYPAKEGWLICGRRAGKSFILALVAVFLACFGEYRQHLTPGERGTVFIIATDRKQARTILRYIRALLTRVSLLAQMIEREWQEGFDLNNAVTIEVATASFKSTRGFTNVAILLDEVAFFASEDSASPDEEILRALRPGMLTIPGAKLLAASSPYARRGVLFDAYRKHFGKDNDPILVWQADTQTMNPAVDAAIIAEAYESDPIAASAEYGAVFRSDIAAFVARDAVDAVVSESVHERAYLAEHKYFAFIDPAGGSGQDSFTLAIGHRENGIAVLDVVRERKPRFSPEEVTREFADILKSYHVDRAISDRFGGEWVREPFKTLGIEVVPSAKPKSDLYGAFLPLLNSRKVDLLDNAKLIAQLVGLERKTARSGRDSIDHSPGAHDDLINAAAGCIVNVGVRKYKYDSDLNWIDGDNDDPAAFRAARRQAYIGLGGMRRFF